MHYYAVSGAYIQVMDELLYSIISTLTVISQRVNEQTHIDTQMRLWELVSQITGETKQMIFKWISEGHICVTKFELRSEGGVF